MIDNPANRADLPALRLAVRPGATGWRLEGEGQFEPLQFRSGRIAEVQARTLARRMAETGRDVVVEVYDRSAALVGAWRCYRPDSPTSPEASPSYAGIARELLWLPDRPE